MCGWGPSPELVEGQEVATQPTSRPTWCTAFARVYRLRVAVYWQPLVAQSLQRGWHPQFQCTGGHRASWPGPSYPRLLSVASFYRSRSGSCRQHSTRLCLLLVAALQSRCNTCVLVSQVEHRFYVYPDNRCSQALISHVYMRKAMH